MLVKINVGDIFKDHFNTLRNDRTKELSIGDIALFFVLPLVVGVIAVFIHGSLGNTEVTVLVTAFSIFTALLFNLLVMIFDLISRSEDSGSVTISVLKRELLRQTYNNIAFCILVAIAAIALLLLYLLDSKLSFTVEQLAHFISFFVYYLTALFLLTLLMILKRVHSLISRELRTDPPESSAT